jgi:isoquinoline 1-oxidoreductase beta subunit
MADHVLDKAVSRRTLLKAGFAASGSLVLGFYLPERAARAAGTTTMAAPFAPNGFVRIDTKGHISLVMPMVEMGQGIYTAQAMMLAEELDVGLNQVTVEHAPANDALYANAILHIQTTGLSSSVRAFWTPLRQAGAVARSMLVSAAAAKWNVDPAACTARQGAVHHEPTSRRLQYGELVTAAAALPVPRPDSVPLKQPKDFKLIGTSAHRLDTAHKVDGSTKFGIDVRVPGMKIAAVAISPVLGGKPKSVDQRAALAVKGVHQVVQTDEAVAVVADHMGAAKKGLQAAAIQWDDGANAKWNTQLIVSQLETASRQPGVVARNDGDVQKAVAGAAQRLEAVYQVPFLAHATMEPMNCTVHVQRDRCDIWVGTQCPTLTQSVVATALGLPRDSVEIHNQYLGGGFGRRLEPDGSLLAAKLAKLVNGPVKIVWTREEDIRHDMYRPYYYDRLSAELDASGMPVAWTHRVAGSSIFARYVPDLFIKGLDPDAVESAANPPYAFPAIHVDYVRVEPAAVRTAFWRGVGPTHNVFVVESFLDELAHAAKQDPVAYRRKLLAKNPRALGVLNLAAEKAGWGSPLPAGRGRGVSLQSAFGSYLSSVAEVEVARDGNVRVRKIVCAVDCGITVNPDIVAAQMEGGTLFGLTAALYGQINIENGRVKEGNFDTYRPLRINEAPVVETYLVKNTEAPGGIGEAGTAIIAPAVTNAIFAATGKRIRVLPIDTAMRATTS